MKLLLPFHLHKVGAGFPSPATDYIEHDIDLNAHLIKKHNTNFKGVGQPLRIALVGSRFGPGIYNIILSLTKDEVIKRISKIN